MGTDPADTGVEAPSVFETEAWAAAWARNTVEDADVVDNHPPIYLTRHSPFWAGYENDVGVEAIWTEPVVTVGTVYAFFGPARSADTPELVRSTLARAREHVARTGAAGVLVLNLPSGSARFWAETEPPRLTVKLDAAYRRTPGEGDDPVVGSVSKRVRTDWRRRWRRATEMGLVLREETHPAPEHIDDVLALANGSAERHGWVPIYDHTTALALFEVPGCRLVRAELEGQTVAGFVAFEHDRCLYLWAGGTHPELAREVSPYLFLLYELLSTAADRGWTRIEFGRGNDQFKRRYGFTGVDLWSHWFPRDDAADRRYTDRLQRLHEGLGKIMDA